MREHRAAGHRTVLITGALELAVQPLAPLFDHIIAARIDSREGRYTGEMIDVPPTGEVRAQMMVDWAAEEGLDLGTGRGVCRCSFGHAHAGGRGLSGGGQPRDPAGDHR